MCCVVYCTDDHSCQWEFFIGKYVNLLILSLAKFYHPIISNIEISKYLSFPQLLLEWEYKISDIWCWPRQHPPGPAQSKLKTKFQRSSSLVSPPGQLVVRRGNWTILIKCDRKICTDMGSLRRTLHKDEYSIIKRM